MTHLVCESNQSGWPTLSFAMGAMEIFLYVFVGHFIAVQSVIHEQDETFLFPGFFDDMMPFPFQRNFEFPPNDPIFSSWISLTPDFHMLAELPPIMNVPRVEVYCDESKLTLLVDKRSKGVTVTGEEIRLGDGCYSNRELPIQFVFTYNLDECGTMRVMQNGLPMFTNSLHLNLKKPPRNWWQTPSTVHISCIPKRSYANPNLFVSTALPENGKMFHIKAMNPSWTSTADSNVYKRGQAVNLQISAQTRPEQQLFIQSCFVSASPEPQTKPRHAVILNKGCTAPLGSPHVVVQFVPSNRQDVVNFVLNTSYLISELYIHCSVLLSSHGVTFGSKSCNYNVIQSRWEDLSGTAEVCECCSSKCKGLSMMHHPEDAKAVVRTGPLVIVDKDVETSPELFVSELQETSSASVSNSMQSDGAATEDTIVSGTSTSRSKFSSPPQGVVVVSQDQDARLTLWLPGHNEAPGSESEDGLKDQLKASDKVSNDLPEVHTDQETHENTLSNKVGDENLNLLTLVDGWIIPPRLEKAAIAEESQRKMHLGRFGLFDTEKDKKDVPLLDGIGVNVLKQNDFNQMSGGGDDDAAVMSREGTNDARPVIRSKLQFSKGVDGSETLSYEEEMVKQQEGGGVITRFGTDGTERKSKPRQKGLRLIFLDLLRRMDKAE